MPASSRFRDDGRPDEPPGGSSGRPRRGDRPDPQEDADGLPAKASEIRATLPTLIRAEDAVGDGRITPGPTPTAAGPLPGEIGDYRILREVGRGGMGEVYEAEQISLGRRVALKVLPRHVVGDRKALERFHREAKAAARLHHTNIVPVFEVGRDGDAAFYAMQFIRGQGLDQVIDELRRLRERGARPADEARPEPAALDGIRDRTLGRFAESLHGGRLGTEGPMATAGDATAATEGIDEGAFDPDATTDAGAPGSGRPPGEAAMAGPLPSHAILPGGTAISAVDSSGRRLPYFRGVAQIGRQAAQGLAHAHSRGVVHRDVKPSNLLLDTSGVVWITDFGLAKAEDDGLTATGDLLGTLRYMAPERFRGEGDARADIYALGLTLYELLTLRPAHDAVDRLRLVELVKNGEPPRPRALDAFIPRDLETIVLKAIEKEPDRRYQTADAMAEDLRRFLADEPIKARQASATERYWRWARRNPMVAALGAALTAVLVVVTIGSLLTAARFARLAEDAGRSSAAERGARFEADEARRGAEAARAAAQADAYRAMLSEVKALRAGHQLGWREEALDNLARLAVMPAPRRDLAELRTEAVATVGAFGVSEVARFAVPHPVAFSVDFSPDSRTLVTACGNGAVDLWDVPGRRHLRRLDRGVATGRGPEGRGGLARFLPDGVLAVLDAEGGVAFLDPDDGRPARSPIRPGGAEAVTLRADRRGSWLAVGRRDGRIDFHEAAPGAAPRRLDAGWPAYFAVSPDGRWLALQRGDGLVEFAPIDGKGDAFTLPIRGGYISTLAFSPDGAMLAGVDDRSVAIWDVASRQELLRLSGHKETISMIAFSPDGSLVATSSGDAVTRIWDAHDGRPLATLPAPAYLEAIAFSPDGSYLAASAHGGQVCLYRLDGRREQRRLIGHQFGVHRLAFHPGSPRLASSSDDQAVMLWDAESAQAAGRWTADVAWVTGLAISPDGSLIATARGDVDDESSIRLWDAGRGVLERQLTGTTRGSWTLAFDPDGRRLASGDTAGTVLLFEVETGQLLRRDDLGGSTVTSLAFLDEGRSLLVGRHGNGVTLLDLEGTDPPRQATFPVGCTRLVVDRTGHRAVVGDLNGSLASLSLPGLDVVRRLDGAHEGEVVALALSPDGRLLATGGTDRRVVLRDPASLNALFEFPAWTGPLKDVAFDATGRWIAYAGTDSEIALWDLGLVRDELAAVGLAWDQPAPGGAPASGLASGGGRRRSPVPIVGPGVFDQAEFQEASGLVSSGVAAFQQSRYSEAAADLGRADGMLRAMRSSRPNQPSLARRHATCLGFLGSTLRDLGRADEALLHFRMGLDVYESMDAPGANDRYNMACGYAMVAALDDRASPVAREALQARAVASLRSAVEEDPASYLDFSRADHDLDPLRDRADFRALMADAGFPGDPFAGPSTPPGPAPEAGRIGAGDDFAMMLAEADRRRAAGRTIEGLPLLASALAIRADDPASGRSLLIEVAALQAWFGREADLADTCRRAIEAARKVDDPAAAERAAKVCSLRPLGDEAIGEAALALARRAVESGRDHSWIAYFRMALGMAEYRAGNAPAAVEALLAASDAGRGNGYITVTSDFYRAMGLFRLGQDAEARRVMADAADQMRPLPADPANPLAGGANADDLVLWLAYKEAEALLGRDAVSDPMTGLDGP